MCSVDEEDYDLTASLKNDVLDKIPDVCKKCSSHARVVLRKKDGYCESCFVAATNHKFRASLGKTKMLRANQSILVAVSGGLGSAVLLSLLHHGLNADSHKKLRVSPFFIYILDNLSSCASMDSQFKDVNFVLEQCKKYEFSIYVTTSSEYIEDDSILPDLNTVPSYCHEKENKLLHLINSISTATARKDFISKVQRILLIRYAKKLGCSFILTGETSTTLAAKMLSNLAQGRGSQIEFDIGFCDSRDGAVKILRPMKDISSEELHFYATVKNLTYLSTSKTEDSIQSVIHKFVIDLQDNFQATISTVCKTGEKIGSETSVTLPDEETCILCQSALDTQEINSSALQATKFSSLVSSTGPEQFRKLQSIRSGGGDDGCSNCNCKTKKLAISHTDIEECLCYGCRIIFRDLKDNNELKHFKHIVASRRAMLSLKSEINDFLL